MTEPEPNGQSGNHVNAPLRRQKSRRLQRFDSVLGAESVDKFVLADLAWSGVPQELSRSEVWQLLLEYRPLCRDSSAQVLQSKHQEYLNLKTQYYGASVSVQRLISGEA